MNWGPKGLPHGAIPLPRYKTDTFTLSGTGPYPLTFVPRFGSFKLRGDNEVIADAYFTVDTMRRQLTVTSTVTGWDISTLYADYQY